MTFVYKGDAQRARIWAEQFASRIARHAAPLRLARDRRSGAGPLPGRLAAAERVEEALPNLEILFSVGAGVDQFDLSALPRHLKVVRMVEPGLTACMCEYVSWAVLSLHRDVPRTCASSNAASGRNTRCGRPSRRVGVRGSWARSAARRSRNCTS